MNKKKVYSTTITTLENSLPALLDAADLPGCIGKKKTVLIKPNLVEALAPLVITPVRLTQLLIAYLQEKKENLPKMLFPNALLQFSAIISYSSP